MDRHPMPFDSAPEAIIIGQVPPSPIFKEIFLPIKCFLFTIPSYTNASFSDSIYYHACRIIQLVIRAFITDAFHLVGHGLYGLSR